jgi:hypothetical protein
MIEVSLEQSGSGWLAVVRVDHGGEQTEHRVSVSEGELARYGGGDPATLVRRSFEFLLEREPATSILRRFALGDIERYFPEYERVIRATG